MPDLNLNSQEIAIADFIHVAEPNYWMYCFNCGQSHFHYRHFEFWECPNCHHLRVGNKECTAYFRHEEGEEKS